MEFRILGRLEARDGGRDVTPGRAQARALLGLFLLHANERLTTGRIIEDLWGETPPATADKALQGHISALRKLLGPERIQTEHGGYRLEVAAGELDLERFSSAVAAARSASQPPERARLLADALALWRGAPLADMADEPFAQVEVGRLQALRLAAEEDRIDAELATGGHASVLPVLERLVAENPMAEGLRAKLMLALYRSGRQADALRAYRDGRRVLAEELGIDPGLELQELERRILAQDPGLAAPPAAGVRAAPRQERKTVTVLVIEVVARPAADPEDIEREAAPALAGIRAAVERVGGRAEPLFVNAVVGLFGAPRTHEDDAVRAVRAALEILGQPWAADGTSLRGGIDTDEALVTVDGQEVSVTGQVLAAATRLQAVAPLGEIVVGPGTHRATATRIDYREVGPGTWSPRALVPGAGAASPASPFVGRVPELAQLDRSFRRARDDGAVHLVTLIAEPGAGKSRLVLELRTQLEAERHAAGPRWLQGHCLPYGDGVTYWALGEIAKAWAGILDSDDSEASADKLQAAIGELEATESERAWLTRSIGPLVGIEGAAADRELGFAAWRQLLEAIASRQPTVVVFEDLHWADEGLLDFVDHLVDRAVGVPLLVLCTARPELLEARPTWSGGKRNATTVVLPPLSDSDTGRLFSAVLGHAPGDAWIRRAGGNPLYAQELARVLARSETADVAQIPESLQAVIAAHLDALSPDLKAVAADASVVGEVFWAGSVAKIGGLETSEVDARLQRLVASEVVRRRRRSSVAGEDEYEFLHVLVRDIAYGQIPRRDRIAKHQEAAAWIERLAGDRTGAHAELLAYHSLEAFELARRLGREPEIDDMRHSAVEQLLQAGDAARRLDVGKAGTLYGRALDLAAPGDPKGAAARARLGDVAQLSGRLEEAEALTRQAIDGLEAAGEAKGAAAAMVILESVLWRLGRSEDERRALLDRAIGLLEPLGPSPELVQAYSQTAANALYAGLSSECLAWSARASAMADAVGLPSLKCQPRLYLGIARFEMGDVAGIDDVRAAIDLGLDAGLSWETGHAMSDLGATVWLSEGPGAGIPLKERAAAFADSRGMTAMANTTRAQTLWLQFDAGDWDEILEGSAALLAASAGSGGEGGRVAMMARSARARVLVSRGDAQAALQLEDEILAPARAIGDLQDLAPALATAACIRAGAGNATGALELIAELEERTRDRDVSRRVHELPPITRICTAFGATDLAARFHGKSSGYAPTRAMRSLAASRAALAEAGGDIELAAERYAEAAQGWATYGCPEEEGHARLGAARCLAALDRGADAARQLDRAAALARALGVVQILEEASQLQADLGT